MQLVLPVTFSKQDSFDLFVPGQNLQLVEHIKNLIENKQGVTQQSQRICVVTGAKSSGKTHLLLAACEYSEQFDLRHQYIDLQGMQQLPPQALLGLVNQDVVCLDNVQLVDNNKQWQTAIFDVINQFIESNNKLLLISTRSHPDLMNYRLLDLKTRLDWGTKFTILPLKDDLILKALVLHMQALGFVVEQEVAKFLVSRCKRDMHQLMSMVKTLDEVSLAKQRKITIPFVKTVLKI